MKRLKKSILALIMMIIIILTIVFGKSNISLAAPDGTWQSSKATVTLGEYINSGANGWMRSYWNTYCLQHGTALRDGMTHFVKYKVEIRGNTATFYKSDGSVKGTVVTKENNVLAAILTPNDYIPSSVLQHSSRKNSDWWSIGMYVDYSHAVHPTKTYEDYSRAQLALYWYMNDWANACSAKGVSPNWSYGAKGIYNVGDAGGGVAFCEDLAKYGTFNVDLYYLEESSYQNLLVAIPYDATEEIPTETTSVKVQKVWKEDSNDTSNRKPVTVQLKANGVVKDTQELSSSNGWSYTFTNLPTGATYSVSEVSVPGYTTIPTGDAKHGFTITNTLELTSVTATKVWEDDGNKNKNRPDSIEVSLYDGENCVKTAKMTGSKTANEWECTFSNLPNYKNGELVKYTVKETKYYIGTKEYTIDDSTGIPGYNVGNEGNVANGYKITNTPTTTQINVTKKWEDSYNNIYDFDEMRPDSITVELYENTGTNGKFVTTGKTITLNNNSSNEWKATFTDLPTHKNKKEIEYKAVEQTNLTGYTSADGTRDNGYTITNAHTIHYDGYIEISGTVWSEGEAGKDNNTINNILDGGKNEKKLSGIKVTLRDKDGNLFDNTSTATTDSEGKYTIKVNYDNSQNVYKLYSTQKEVDAKLKDGAYVEFEYDGMLYTTLEPRKDEDNGSKAKEIYTKINENELGREGIDNKYDEVDTGTPKIEYNEDRTGIKYPTDPQSAVEYWSKTTAKATTKEVLSFGGYDDYSKETREVTLKYCNGNGTYIRTNPEDASKTPLKGTKNLACNSGQGHEIEGTQYNVKVAQIKNVNLGLFDREQPDVAIFSDISEVEVKMNNQQYTYLYNERGSELQAAGELKTKFQNKDTYTYRRPVNPADIAYINKNDAQMDVYVTYEIKVANLSATLKTTIDEIVNVYDSQYVIDTIKKGNTTLSDKEDVTIYEKSEKYNQIKLKNLGITLDPETSANEENTIVIRYKVINVKIKGLLNDKAPLNNAVEILKYKTTYGEETVYAEQRTNLKEKEQGREERKSYAGYDFDSHPGNAGIKLVGETDSNGNTVFRLQSTQNLVEYLALDGKKKMGPEDDTDIAPSFVLCLDAPTTLEGIVWEDSDEDKNDNERLGDGKRQGDENKVKNVKIELLEVNEDETVKEAILYTIDQDTGDIVKEQSTVYSGDDGKYTFKGLVTGKEYFIKYTYGNDTNELEKATTISGNIVNARNYKSTIITEEYMKKIIGRDLTDKEWPLKHEAGYSVAVDNMKKRTEIPSLRNGNYDQGVNMYAYTKPFIIPLEMTLKTSGNSEMNGDVKDSNGNKIGNTLDKLDFGIIERPREALIVQKTITDFKITLANGQILLEGDPTTQNLNYVKAIGFKESANIDEAINSVEKRLSVEIDSELIQGAQLEATYKVKVKNNNEIDYDYGESTNYETDGYITTNSLANYYYYGNSAGTKGEMTSTITFVDYLDKDIGQSYTSNDNYWSEITYDTLWKNGLEDKERYISEDVKNELAKGEYRIFQSKSITLEIDGDPTEQEMKVSKLLTSKNDHPYGNYAEIIEIDGKTARTVKGFDKNNKQLEYRPGNYVPSASPNESDDDKVDILVTPPTGITNYITTYIITGLVGLIIIIVGIVFIKKKILTK